MPAVSRMAKAQSLMEFSMVLPLLVGFFFTLLDLSFVFFQATIVSTATRTTTRDAAIKGLSDGALRQQLRERCWGFPLPDERIAIRVIDHTGETAPREFGNYIDVLVTYDLSFLTPVSMLVRGTSLRQVRSGARFQIE